jgi:hypothetical protein
VDGFSCVTIAYRIPPCCDGHCGKQRYPAYRVGLREHVTLADEQLASRYGRFYPQGKKSLHSLARRLGGPQDRCCCRYMSPVPPARSQSFQFLIQKTLRMLGDRLATFTDRSLFYPVAESKFSFIADVIVDAAALFSSPSRISRLSPDGLAKYLFD